jgi:hypothetical protein
MYDPAELASFALSEFERGLEGLTNEDAQIRIPKADGTYVNAITWTVRHVAIWWFNLGIYYEAARTGSPQRPLYTQFTEPDPPTLAEALQYLKDARDVNPWMATRDYAFLDTLRDGAGANPEHLGTYLMRAILHTWFHWGEINAIRQVLGHPEIRFMGPMEGKLEWHPD